MTEDRSSLEFARQWLEAALKPAKRQIRVESVRQGWEVMRVGQSFVQNPICIDGHHYEHGIGVHADSEVRLTSEIPMKRIRGVVGVDQNTDTLKNRGGHCRITFSIETGGQEIWASKPLSLKDGGVAFDVLLPDVAVITLKAEAEDGWIHYAHADWGDLRLELVDGSETWPGESLREQCLPHEMIFGFTYDDKHSDIMLSNWEQRWDIEHLPAGVRLFRKSYHDPQTKLTCILEIKAFDGLPALEWVLRLRNDGEANTPILKDIQAMRVVWACARETTLHRGHGSRGMPDDFRYCVEPVPASSEFIMSAGGGRSSTDWLPYFNLHSQESGVAAAIGWSGQWAAKISRAEDNRVHLLAGLENSHLTLYPGEEIRTPSIALVFWQGEPMDGNNELRRFIIAHHTPRIADKPIQAPFTTGQWGGIKTEKHLRTISHVRRHELEYDFYWMDAGWYGTAEGFSEEEATAKWYGEAGNWSANPIAHPKGLRSISDAAREAGMGLLLWFEPERAFWGTQITQEHPEWFLGDRIEKSNVLLNLGIPEAREWITDFISGRISEWGIGCYRQDFNFEPLPYWRSADTDDRQGMTEIRHIEGLYAFWDELRRRHPNLIIDNCASGGRRLDMELVGRSISLWRSDFQCLGGGDALGIQSHTSGLSYWLPLHGTSSDFRPSDTYYFRSALSAALNFHVPAPEDTPEDYPWDWHYKMSTDYRRARPFYYGDYYPLTPYSVTREAWMAYQMHREDLDAGIILMFRRDKSPYTKAALRLLGLKSDATYVMEDADTTDTWMATGESLMEIGLPASLPQPRSSRLIFYKESA